MILITVFSFHQESVFSMDIINMNTFWHAYWSICIQEITGVHFFHLDYFDGKRFQG